MAVASKKVLQFWREWGCVQGASGERDWGGVDDAWSRNRRSCAAQFWRKWGTCRVRVSHVLGWGGGGGGVEDEIGTNGREQRKVTSEWGVFQGLGDASDV